MERFQGARDLEELRRSLERAWTASTSSDPESWSTENPAWGQCAVSALLVQDLLGGDLLRADVEGISHYWNRLDDGREIDVTRQQFSQTVAIPCGELRTRTYVLSFPETRRRYERLRQRVRQLARVA